MRKQRHKCANTLDKVITHQTLVMPVEQNGEIKLILQCDYTKTFFVFITSSLQNKASTYEYAAEATVTLAQIKLCNFVV